MYQVKQLFFYIELVFFTKKQIINKILKQKTIEELKACCDTGIGALYDKSVWTSILIHQL